MVTMYTVRMTVYTRCLLISHVALSYFFFSWSLLLLLLPSRTTPFPSSMTPLYLDVYFLLFFCLYFAFFFFIFCPIFWYVLPHFAVRERVKKNIFLTMCRSSGFLYKKLSSILEICPGSNCYLDFVYSNFGGI